MNMKGGVGKSTVSAHIGGMLARYKFGERPRRVLLIDYDPQFNLSQMFLGAQKYFSLERARKTILAVLQDDSASIDPFALQVPGNLTPPSVTDLTAAVYRRLDIVPSTLELMYVALGHSETLAPIEERFAKFMQECRAAYDVIILDCHPAGSVFTRTALKASDHVLVPVAPSKFAVRGIGLMDQFVNATATSKSAAPRTHLLFNLMPRHGRPEVETTIRRHKAYADRCLTQTLKRYQAFADPHEGGGFVWSSKKPYSGLAFRNVTAVAREVVNRLAI